MWTFLKAVWAIAKGVPLWVWLVVAAALWARNWHNDAVDAAYAAGDNAARRELSVPLMKAHAAAARNLADMSQYYTQASIAEGKALEFERGLNRCIGARVQMDVITSAVLRGREQQRVAAVTALTQTRKELSDAYASASDRCAAEPVPQSVVRLLDIAAFGAEARAGSADAASGNPGAGVHTRTYRADQADAGTGQAYTANADLALWIIEGWAPALQACNDDKAAIANLRAEAQP
jgi:hypothetical protein